MQLEQTTVTLPTSSLENRRFTMRRWGEVDGLQIDADVRFCNNHLVTLQIADFHDLLVVGRLQLIVGNEIRLRQMYADY